jgi:hypothetical protein
MKISRRQAAIGGVTLLAGTSTGTSAHAERAKLLMRPIKGGEELVVEKFRDAESLTPKDLASRTVYRRAVDAVIWGVPAVTLDMMRQAYFRDAKASGAVRFMGILLLWIFTRRS